MNTLLAKDSSIVIEVIETVFFFFFERHFKCKKQTKASK